jgi:ketosteroid isomerase-like protein
VTPADAIDRTFDAWRRLDPEALIELFGDDASYEDPLFPAALVGHDQMRESIAAAMADLADCSITARSVVESGNTGMVEAEFRSSLAAGGRLDFDFATLVELRDGCITRLAEYFDTRPLV